MTPLRRDQAVASRPSEIQRQALEALSACCPVRNTGGGGGGGQFASALTQDQLVEALSCTVSVLTTWTAGGGGGTRSPMEDNLHSRFLATVVRTLNCLIVEVGDCSHNRSAPIVVRSAGLFDWL